MLEYHIGTSNKLNKWATTHLGGNLSICFPIGQKPLIVFGHDECICKEFLMSAKAWVGPDGEMYVVPKDDGLGIMISTFQS